MGADEVPTYCPLCVSRCGARATVADGAFVALRPDPSHPTGRALCVKGKAAPEIVYHPSRLLHPMRRTRPKGAADPGWEPISWDEALDTIAQRLRAAAASGGPESVGFSSSSPSTSAISDAVDWVQRLIRAFGSPNYCTYMELCGWGRYLAPLYTFGAPVPGTYLPDLERAGCILFWGYNPSVARLAHATSTVAAVARGAKLVVVDPRKAGLASRAHHWLRVRPGTDGALALSLTHVMIENGWYDADFVRDWTNAADVVDGATVWDLLAARCAEYRPEVAAGITGVPAADIVATARTLWESRPVAFYTWSGLEQHSGTTQTIRAIDVLYALTGSLDVPGGNVLFEAVPSNPVDGRELLSAARPPAVGAAERPLGPARFEFVTGEDFYSAVLDGRITTLMGFGGNLVMAHGDSARGRGALRRLDFFAQADLFMNPTAELADVVLPVATPFESEALKIGFEYSQEAQSLVQLRRPLVAPRGEARSDLQILFDLATRLGLGEHFWDGDIDAAWRHQLAPSGITLEQLRSEPAGVRVPLTTRHRKYAEKGFATPSGKVELYSATLAAHGYAGLPAYEEPLTSPRSRPDLADRFPLVLSCAKSLFFCETQHRQVAALRKSAPDPELEIHPETAAARGLAAGDWVELRTPHGEVRARARFNASLDPQVVFGQHGWWEACEELGLAGYPPYGPGSANLNLVLRQTPSDPISGSAPLRATVCDVGPVRDTRAMAIHIVGDEVADQLLTDSPFALLIGMMLDQQYPMEHAFAGPQKVVSRFGSFDPVAIAAADPEEFAALCSTTPAIHRFPGSMAARLQEVARIVADEYDGDASRIWTEAADAKDLAKRLQALPGFGAQKVKIFVALLAKQCGVAPVGWEKVAGDYALDGHRSVADVVDPASLQKVRDYKKAKKAAAKA